MNHSEYNPKNTIILAIMLFFVDAFVMDLGLIAAISLFSVVVFGVPMSVFSMFKKQKPNVALTQSLIFSVMAVSIFGVNAINTKIAESRAETLIEAIERFHQDTSQYPETLEDLVPAYISQVPLAKYTLASNMFHYGRIEQYNAAFLLYVSMPPYGHKSYHFESKSDVSE